MDYSIGDNTGEIDQSGYSSGTASIKETEKMFERMYEQSETSHVPQIIRQYIDSEKDVKYCRILQKPVLTEISNEKDTNSANNHTTDILSDCNQLAPVVNRFMPDSGSSEDTSSSGPRTEYTTDRSSDQLETVADPSSHSQLNYGPDPFVTNRLIMARNMLALIAEDQEENRFVQRKSRFLRLIFNLYHITSMDQFLQAARLPDEVKAIKKYECLLVKIESTVNKYEGQYHDARLVLKQKKRDEHGTPEDPNFDSDVSTPCIYCDREEITRHETLYDFNTSYAARAILHTTQKQSGKFMKNYLNNIERSTCVSI